MDLKAQRKKQLAIIADLQERFNQTQNEMARLDAEYNKAIGAIALLDELEKGGDAE